MDTYKTIDQAKFAARYVRYNMAEHGMTELQPEATAALVEHEAITADAVQTMYKKAEARTRKTGKPARVHAGMYLVVYQGSVWQLERMENAYWIGSSTKCRDTYTDGHDTLRGLIIDIFGAIN